MSNTKYRMIKVAEVPGASIYAQRNSSGGLSYYTDRGGILSLVVDMTLADPYEVKLILDLDRILKKKDKMSTGTRFDTMEFKAAQEGEKTKMPRVDGMNRCIKCGVVLTKDNITTCDFFDCPQT